LGGTVVKKLIFLVLFVVIGCAPKYTVIQNDKESNNVSLSRDFSAYISLPQDNTSSGHLYVGSGSEVASELEFLFSQYLENIVVGNSVESCNQGFDSAKTNGYDYYICPQIMQWEDYATEWNGIPDKIRLKVSIQSTKSEAIIDTFLIEGKGKVMSWGGDHPLDVVKEPMSQWVSSLF
jgi:hypothetical protein